MIFRTSFVWLSHELQQTRTKYLPDFGAAITIVCFPDADWATPGFATLITDDGTVLTIVVLAPACYKHKTQTIGET